MRGILILTFLLIATSAKAASTKPFLVVIDPGHGGPDQGATYHDSETTISEKEVTLALATQIAARLRANGIQAVLTRKTDQEVPLPARTALANRLKADVFLSIHMNSTPSVRGVDGVETYILNHTTDAPSKRLAYLENSVLGAPDKDLANDDPSRDVALIIKDLRLDANLSESKKLACAVQAQLAASSPERNRGVKQALFYVLLGADMPSILVEAGFLNNPRDRTWVLSPQGQRSIGSSVARAILQFKRSRENPKTQGVSCRFLKRMPNL